MIYSHSDLFNRSLSTLSLALTFITAAPFATAIDWTGQTINSSIDYHDTCDPVIFTQATLNNGVKVTFSPDSYLSIHNADFRGVLLKSGAELSFKNGTIFTPMVSFAGLRLESSTSGGSILSFDGTTIHGADFTNLYIAKGSLASFSLTARQKMIFDSAHILGTLSFTAGTMNIDSTAGSGASFKNMVFDAGSVFTIDTTGNWQFTDFTETSFAGTVNLTASTFSNSILTKAKFLAGSDVTLNGTWENVKFDEAVFSGRLTASSSSWSGSDFSRATFSEGSVTLFNNVLLGPKGSNVSFDGAKFLGTITFANSNLNPGALAGNGGSFKNAIFGANSVFTVNDSGSWAFTDFTGATFAGRFLVSEKSPNGNGTNLQNSYFDNSSFLAGSDVTLNGNITHTFFRNTSFSGKFEVHGSMTGADFTESKFHQGSNTIFTGNYNSTIFDRATFAGILKASSSSFQSASFLSAVFLGKTTLEGSIAGADFTGAIFGSGSDSKFTVAYNGAKMNGVLIQNEAKVYLTGSPGDGFQFMNSTVDVGGNLTISNDGWGSGLPNARFNGSVFAGSLLIGIANSSIYNKLDLINADFTGAQFTGTTEFRYVNMESSTFRGADLSGTIDFKGANVFAEGSTSTLRSGRLDNADFSEVQLTGNINFTNVNLNDASFEKAQLTGKVTFTTDQADRSGKMNRAAFDGALIGSKVVFNSVDLSGSTFVLATVDGAAFNSVKLDNANLHKIYIDGNTKFNGGSGVSADFSEGTFRVGSIANFTDINLTGAIFDKAQFLGQTAFSGGNAAHSSFIRTLFDTESLTGFTSLTMTGANFSNAFLHGRVNFTHANLSEASFEGAQLTGTINFIGNGSTTGLMNRATFDSALIGNTVTFDRVNLSASTFLGATIDGASFNSSILDEAVFNQAVILGETDVNGGSAVGAKFVETVFDGNSITAFTTVNMTGADFTNAVFKGDSIVFDRSNLSSALFVKAQLNSNVTFKGDRSQGSAIMRQANFTEAELTGKVRFEYADLQNASFQDAKLTGSVEFEGIRSEGLGSMNNSHFNGAYLGSGVLFKDVDLTSSNYLAATIDGATFNAVTLSSANFTDATIKGNTTFTGYSWLSNIKFNGASFQSEGNTQTSFINVYLQGASFAGTHFNGNVLFTRSGAPEERYNWYNQADFSEAVFNAGSNVLFDGSNGSALGVMKFAGNANLNGNLGFRNIDASGISFSQAAFGSTSNTSFTNSNLNGMSFDGIMLDGGAVFAVDGQSSVDNVTFANAVFDKGSEFKFYDTRFAASDRTLNFANTQFGGVTRFAEGTQATDLSSSDFRGAVFQHDSSRGTTFHLQNTGFTLDQFKTTQNYRVTNGREIYDFRGMDISNNATFSGQDFRRSKIDSAKFGGLWANDFRDSTYGSGVPVSYGYSYIDANGNLGGLDLHAEDGYHQNFLIRAKHADSSLAGVYLMANSTTINSGIAMIVGQNNDIFAQHGHSGLAVKGTISMDSTSVFHMRDGAALEFFFGSLLEITVKEGENYILVADYDNMSSLLGADLLEFKVYGDPNHAWKLEMLNHYHDNPNNQFILYYDNQHIPEPASSSLALLALSVLALSRKRR